MRVAVAAAAVEPPSEVAKLSSRMTELASAVADMSDQANKLTAEMAELRKENKELRMKIDTMQDLIGDVLEDKPQVQTRSQAKRTRTQ